MASELVRFVSTATPSLKDAEKISQNLKMIYQNPFTLSFPIHDTSKVPFSYVLRYMYGRNLRGSNSASIHILNELEQTDADLDRLIILSY